RTLCPIWPRLGRLRRSLCSDPDRCGQAVTEPLRRIGQRYGLASKDAARGPGGDRRVEDVVHAHVEPGEPEIAAEAEPCGGEQPAPMASTPSTRSCCTRQLAFGLDH